AAARRDFKKEQGGLLSAIIALEVAATTFLVFPLIVIQLTAWWFTHHHPGDPSAGDGATWAVIFAAPILMSMDVVGSLYAGFFAYVLLYKRLLRKTLPEAAIL